ncbi:MAG: MGMT family protein [Vicinamibacteria bacterium]|nr:MGMT family protein [Vicinamibacteria bacterium]
MVKIHVHETNGKWYGLGYSGDEVAATAVGSSRQETLRRLARSLPDCVNHEIVEDVTEFARRMIVMLVEIESGNEQDKRFSIASDHVPETSARVLKTAAAIPVGYVTSYSEIARAANTAPRFVGRVMAANPLYPIVPCHRVVGADFSLVGYRGGKKPSELRAKLARLRSEARGRTEGITVQVEGREFKVFPVECAVRRAGERIADSSRQRTLF